MTTIPDIACAICGHDVYEELVLVLCSRRAPDRPGAVPGTTREVPWVCSVECANLLPAEWINHPVHPTEVARNGAVAVGNGRFLLSAAPSSSRRRSPPATDASPVPNDDDCDEDDRYYDCRNDEVLSHHTVEEAVADYIDGFLSPGCDVSAIIRECGEIEVNVFEREKISDGWLDLVATSALEHAAESFGENYGNPDDDDDDLGPEQLEASKPAMIAVLREFAERGTVWRCNSVRKFTLSEEEVEVMMRKERPDWWEND